MTGGKKNFKVLAKEKRSRSNRAGLKFPVGRIHRMLRTGNLADRIVAGAPVYLAAVMEYLTTELLELSGNIAIDSERDKITPRDIKLSILLDPELKNLFSDVTIPEGGVLPIVHAVILHNKIQMMEYFKNINYHIKTIKNPY